MVAYGKPLRVVGYESGPQTNTGAGDVAIDSLGNRWRLVDGRTVQGTGDQHGYILPDGRIVSTPLVRR